MEIKLEDAKELIQFARNNIINYIKSKTKLEVPPTLKEKFKDKLGAFVTLQKRKDGIKMLRGCIGYTQPIYPLYQVIGDVSLSAAFNDPRFPSVRLEEMDNILIEISILTKPKLIEIDDPIEYLSKIKIGRDGLYIKRGERVGLLLPQVPVDNDRNWDVKTFLEHLCMKAFLPQNAWKNKNTEIYAFQAIIFEEEEPNGKIKRKKVD